MTNRHLERAAHLAPIVEHVHGAHHPELTRVRQIIEELQNLDNTAVALTLFRELRSVTDNYAIPNDVCEAFETTYNALKRADKHLTAA